ncbi:MAG: META domain-containing protein [Jiangellaceae bacterium]
MTSRGRHVYLVMLSTVVLVVGLGACGGDEASRTATAGLDDDPDLVGRSFVSTEVRGHDLVEETSVRLSFESDRVSATAGCNTFTGPASWDDGTLAISADSLAATMMGCEPDLQAQDDWLTGFLTSSPTLELDGSTLNLGDDESGMTLEESAGDLS